MPATTDVVDSAAPAELTPPMAVGPDNERAGGRRSRALISGIATSVVSRGAAAVAPLILIPITLRYLGPEVYGLWMAVGALASMALWADLGLGNGLLTKLSPCHAIGDWAAARRYIATTYAVLGTIAGVMLCVLWSSAGAVPWASMFNVTDPEVAPLAQRIALVCLSALIINIPLSLVQRVQYASQKVAQSNIWQALGSLASVGLAAIAVAVHASPTTVVASSVAGPVLMNVINSVYVYLWAERRLKPHPRFVDRRFAASLMRLGGQFFVLSIVTSIALNADNLLIAHARGLAAVTEFSVPARIFAGLGLIVTLVNLPLWPANGDALARGDHAWIKRTTRRMTMLSSGAVLISSVLLVLGGSAFIPAWTGSQVRESPMLLAGLAAWWLLFATVSPRLMVLNAAEVVRPQLVGWILFLGLNLPFKWLVARKIGIVGVPWVGAISYFLCLYPTIVMGFRRALSGASVAVRGESR